MQKTLKTRATVLFICNSHDPCPAVREGLVGCGYEVIEVSTRREALIRCLVGRPDVIVIDFEIRALDGLLQALRASGVDRQTPIIVAGAYKARNNSDMAQAIGVADYICKPFELSELLSRISDLLARRQCSIPISIYCGRILVAMSNSIEQMLISTDLRRLGFNVVCTARAEQSLRNTLCNVFDMVLVDVNMPEMDGLTAVQMLRRRGYIRPIIALAADVRKGEKAKYLAAGCCCYLTRPVCRAELCMVIASHFSAAHDMALDYASQQQTVGNVAHVV
jgi:two-component system sensor histidine kinase/response regulator